MYMCFNFRDRFYFFLRMDHNDFSPVHVLLAVVYTCIVLINTHTRHILHDNNNIIVVLTLVSNFVYMNVLLILFTIIILLCIYILELMV